MGRTTITVSDETKKQLHIVEGELMAKNGTNRSVNDVIRALIEFYRERNKR